MPQASKFISSPDNPVFGLGTSQVASLGRRLSYRDALGLFDTAFSGGIDIIDTADAYGSGDSEYLTGKILNELGREPFIITKAGLPHSALPEWASPVNQVIKKVKHKLNFKKQYSEQYVISSLNKSLKRLRKKQAGALLLHELTGSDTKKFDCWKTLKRVKETGLVSMAGISSNEPAVVEEGLASGTVEIVETRIQLGSSDSGEIAKLCSNKGIPFVANEIMGPYKSDRYDFDAIMRGIKNIKGMEAISVPQLIIAMTFLVYKPACILLGTTNKEHLAQNIRSTQFIPGIKENLDIITKLFSDNRKS